MSEFYQEFSCNNAEEIAPKHKERDGRAVFSFGKNGVAFLGSFTSEPDLENMLLSDDEINSVANGIARLREAASPRRGDRNYEEIIKTYIGPNGSAELVHEQLFPELSLETVRGVLRRLIVSCQKTAQHQLTIENLIELGGEEAQTAGAWIAARLGTTAFNAIGVERLLTLPEADQKSMGEYDTDDFMAWQRDALCAQVGLILFFPDKNDPSVARDAKQVCKACEVREICLDYALQNEEEFGIWGGMSSAQRRKIKNRQKRHQ